MKKKFKSFEELDSYLMRTHSGGASVLDDIYDLERKASKHSETLRKPSEVRNRILNWWNTKTEVKPQILSHRTSFILTDLLKKEIKRREKLHKVI